MDMLRGGEEGDGTRPEEEAAASLRNMCLRSLPWSSEEQPHVLCWSDEEAERLLGGSSLFDEAMGIRSDMAGSAALLAGLIEPTVKWVLSEAFPGGGDDLAELGLGTNDLDQVYRRLFSNSVRAAFVVLMSRSIDESLMGAAGEDDIYDWDYYNDDDDDDDDPARAYMGSGSCPSSTRCNMHPSNPTYITPWTKTKTPSSCTRHGTFAGGRSL